MATKYMIQMEGKLKSDGLTDNTATDYVRRLIGLNGGKFTNLKFLRDTDVIMEKLSNYAPSTQESYVGMIISIMTRYPTKTNDIARRKFAGILKEPSKYFIKRERGTKTEAQKKNWLDREDMLPYITAVEEKGMKASRKRKDLTTKEYDDILNYFLISLYTKIPPRRNKDYMLMKINNEEGNSYDIDTNEFVFRDYKTSGTYGEQRMSLNEYPEFNKIMKMYMNKRIENEDGHLFTKHDGENLMKSDNVITRRLNKIFGGKKISSTALRNMYVKDKYSNINKEMKADADAMGHSIGTQQTVYIKTDE